LLERPLAGPDARAAVLVCLDFGDASYGEGIEEFARLAESAGAVRHVLVKGPRRRPHPKFFAGTGKLAEIAHAASALNAVPDTYRRYLESDFRSVFRLEGTPLRIEFRSGRNPYVDRRI